jgi:FkbM family methyltransferase
VIDRALVRIGHVIGKPPGWERFVRAIVPPQRYANDDLDLVRQADGYVFPVDRGTLIGWSVHFFGAYEPEVRDEIRRRLQPGDTALDIGANVGWHTLLMATRVGPGGRVYAFEPNPSTRERLEHAVAINRLAHVRVDRRAVAERVGQQTFDAPPAGHVWDGTGRLTGEPAPIRQEPESAGASERVGSALNRIDRSDPAIVTCTTVDAFAAEQQIDRIALIKIDVEGLETAVLRGAQRVLETSRPAVVFEYDPAYVGRSGANGAELSAWFHARGYRLYELGPRGGGRPIDLLGSLSTNVLALDGRAG